MYTIILACVTDEELLSASCAESQSKLGEVQQQARQPCLQKPLPNGKGFANKARAKGDSPLNPHGISPPYGVEIPCASRWLDVGSAHYAKRCGRIWPGLVSQMMRS